MCREFVLYSQPIRVVRLDSEHGQSDGSLWITDFWGWTFPEVTMLGTDQKVHSLQGREWPYSLNLQGWQMGGKILDVKILILKSKVRLGDEWNLEKMRLNDSSLWMLDFNTVLPRPMVFVASSNLISYYKLTSYFMRLSCYWSWISS